MVLVYNLLLEMLDANTSSQPSSSPSSDSHSDQFQYPEGQDRPFAGHAPPGEAPPFQSLLVDEE